MKMLQKILSGSGPQKKIKQYRKLAVRISQLRDNLAQQSDEQLQNLAAELKQKVDQQGDKDELMIEAFALGREVSRRVLQMEHFDVQLLGAMALFDGYIAQMKTGEGKTLACTLAVYWEYLQGRKVHVVTVNDYLAARDGEWMGRLYKALGMSVGINVAGMSIQQKQEAYLCDVVYGTNNQFGFDYLQDNMRLEYSHKIQQQLDFAIVDEVDSILIDEARTPLIISGESDENIDAYPVMIQIGREFEIGEAPQEESLLEQKVNAISKEENQEQEQPPEIKDIYLEEKNRNVTLTETGFKKAESLFWKYGMIKEGSSLYDRENLQLMHLLQTALRALHLFARDRDYIVKDKKVVIVDEFTGRLMEGRRYGDGLHQALEAKESLKVEKETITLASTSFQNYFRLYGKLAGMTGTAQSEAEEFEFIYGLQVAEIPTHREMIRVDANDLVYQTFAAKQRAIMQDVIDCHTRGQPVLIGTASISHSEELAAILQQKKLPHHVLNANFHEQEAKIIAQAGAAGSITIATNMAGRGTDIVLGGNVEYQIEQLVASGLSEEELAPQKNKLLEEWKVTHKQVVEQGGLRIIGTERHESRRIDNQLRGRSGRQGDPGYSVFYLSFEDQLIRVFASEKITGIINKLNLDPDDAIDSKMVTRAIEKAQQRIENQNFDIRRHLIRFDDIVNKQRNIVYDQRNQVLASDEVDEINEQLRQEYLSSLFERHLPVELAIEQWEVDKLTEMLKQEINIEVPVKQWIANESLQAVDIHNRCIEFCEEHYRDKFSQADPDRLNDFTRKLLISIIDQHWRSHLTALEFLRASVNFRGVAQKNPFHEFQRESYEMFEQMLANIRTDLSKVLYGMKIEKQPEEQETPPPVPIAQSTVSGGTTQLGGAQVRVADQPPSKKVGRNEPCPCGSGKKFKQCHGKI